MMTMRIAGGRGFRRGVPAVTAAALVAGTLAMGGPAVAATRPQDAGTTAAVRHAGSTARAGGVARHWGFYFGDKSGGKGNPKLTPAPMNLPTSVAQVATSNSTDYALLSNGQVWAWGQGNNGELGNGSDADSFSAAVQVIFPAGVKIAYLPTDAMPFDTALAVDTHGNAWGWGFNSGGSLCLGNYGSYDEPVELPLGDVTTLAGAYQHAVYDSDGTVYSCGANGYGVLGDNSTKNSTKPVRVSGLAGQHVTQLVSSWENAGALLANGTFLDWGYNAAGQLGDGTTGGSSAVPVTVSLPDSSPVVQVGEGGSASNNGQTIALLRDGAVYAWGNDAYAQLGDGNTKDQSTPERVAPPAGVSYETVASGGATSYAISTTGDVYAWGDNSEGEVGDGTRVTATEPVEVLSGAALISATAGTVTAASSAAQG
jgi:alpha-tubulin suppressor-like RCC1 family protein